MPKSKTTGLEEQLTTTNRFSTLSEENTAKEAKYRTKATTKLHIRCKKI
jgi:hypothetical protein